MQHRKPSEELIIIKFKAIILAGLLGVTLLAGCADDSTTTSDASEQATASVSQSLALSGAEILEYNALTGEALEDGVESGLRPVGIMVNNAQAALPQRGISSADAIIEMVTEGGVTRLLALYSNVADVPEVGPVRSARDQHLQFAMPLNAIYVHIGSSIYAENLLNAYTYLSVDGLYLGTTAFVFDEERADTRAQEHCWYTNGSLIQGAMTSVGLAATGELHSLLTFANDGKDATKLTSGDAPDVRVDFSGDNTVQLTYNADEGVYYKWAYGSPHVDELDGSQLQFKNVLLLEAELGMKPDDYCTDFLLTSGTGYYICEGKYQEVFWEKGDPEDPLRLYDADGDEIVVATGKSYIGVLGSDAMATLVMDVSAPVVEEATDDAADATGDA